MKVRLVFALAAALATIWATPALAFFETNDQELPGEWAASVGVVTCGTCHDPAPASSGTGPHGGYNSGTHACDTCHTLHDSLGSLKLLPGDTVKATCQVCHDGTGGWGVYGTIAARGLTVGADHSVETTNVVPGGSAADGGGATMTFRGVDGTLTCSDCHSPHATNVVTEFLGERQRVPGAGYKHVQVTDRLLKQQPGGTDTPVQEYGSDWCAACHAGRASGLPGVHNHPVESSITQLSPYNYRELAIIDEGPYPTSSTVLGPAGIDTYYIDPTNPPAVYNRAYLMPYPRTGAQAGHLPICQQCHEDTRDVGTLSADGTEASPSVAQLFAGPYGPGDGRTETDNPRFQNFPHETEGYRMLVEAETTYYADDLCLNCHPAAALP